MIPGVIASGWRLTGPLAINASNVTLRLYTHKTTNFGYVSATGGSTVYSFSSTALPTGLALNTSTGYLTGDVVAAVGSYSVTFTVTDVSTSFTKQTTVTFTVTTALALSTASLNTSGSVGTVYSSSISATGGAGTYIYSFTGSLPNGLSLNTSTGAITGTPSTGGTSSATFKVTDADSNSVTSSAITFSITVTLVVSDSDGSGTIVKADGNTMGTISATGGTGPYTYSYAGNLPTGTSFGASYPSYGSSGSITGTVATAGAGGSFSVTFYAKDSLGNTGQTTVTYSVAGTAPNAVTGLTATVTNSTTVALSWSLPVGGGPITSLSIASTPATTGLSFSPGINYTSTSTNITSTFVAGQSYTFTVTTTNATGSASATSNSVQPLSNTVPILVTAVGGGGGGGWYTGGAGGDVVIGNGAAATVGTQIVISVGQGGTYIGGTSGGTQGATSSANDGGVTVGVAAYGGVGGASGSSTTGANKGSGGRNDIIQLRYSGGTGTGYAGGGGAGNNGNGGNASGSTSATGTGGNGGTGTYSTSLNPLFPSGWYSGYGGFGHGTHADGTGTHLGDAGSGGQWEAPGQNGFVVVQWKATDYSGTPASSGLYGSYSDATYIYYYWNTNGTLTF